MGESEGTIARRELLIGGAALLASGAALLAMPRFALAQPMTAGGVDVTSSAATRSLLTRASRSAFADLSKPDGFWDNTVARINLPALFAKRSSPAVRPIPREELQHRLNTLAQRALPRASATVDRGIARLASMYPHPLGSEPTAATTALRQSMGPRLVNAMIPALATALRQHEYPVIRQAMMGLRGVSVNDVAHALANETDNAIWYAIGAAEAEVRRGAA
jgi:hypothetical protein